MPANKRLLTAEQWIDPTLRLTVSKKKQNGTVPRHWHNFFELELILDGVGSQQYNGKEYELRRGCVYFLTPADEHEVHVRQELTMYNVMFSGDRLPKTLAGALLSERQRVPSYLDEKQLQQLSMQLELLLQEYSRADALQSLFLQSVLQSVLIMGLRAVNRLPVERPSDSAQVAPLQQAVLYLQTHFAENPSLAETAAVAGMNRTYFCEQFRRHMGRGYSDYLTVLKLDSAKHQLRTGNAPVKTVCMESGFSSMSNFLRVFRSQVGMSPTEYRKTARPFYENHA